MSIHMPIKMGRPYHEGPKTEHPARMPGHVIIKIGDHCCHRNSRGESLRHAWSHVAGHGVSSVWWQWAFSRNGDPLVTLEQDMATLRRLYPAVLPHVKELNTVFYMAAHAQKGRAFTEQAKDFLAFLKTISQNMGLLGQTELSPSELRSLLGMRERGLSPEQCALREYYGKNWDVAYQCERLWFQMLCETSDVAFRSEGRELSIWSRALESFFCPEERMGAEFSIPQNDKAIVRRILEFCRRRSDVCGPLMEDLKTWKKEKDQPPTELPVPSYMH